MAERMPVFFIGHGNPMNAIEDNEFSRAWIEAAKDLPTPRAIVCISAHWESVGTEVSSATQPRTIHDFYGFPPEMYTLQYPAAGLPELAEEISNMVTSAQVLPNPTRGLDHGSWSVLMRMFPEANIPVLQISLDQTRSNQFHYDLGNELKKLRDEGVLVIGSGNIVHNLSLVVWEDTAFPWAKEYDEKIKEWILTDDHQPIIHFEEYGKPAFLSINTGEHYEPLLYVLGMKEPEEQVQFFAERIWGGSVSMRSLRIG